MSIVALIDGAAVTMTSTDLCDLVNTARVELGENEVRRNDFTARCRDELDDDHYESFVVTNPNKTGEAHSHAFVQTRFTPEGIAWIAKRYTTPLMEA